MKLKEKYIKISRDTEALNESTDKKKLAKCRADLSAAETAYKGQISVTNRVQENYYTKDMPYLVEDFQRVLVDRIQKLQEAFTGIFNIANTDEQLVTFSVTYAKEEIGKINTADELIALADKQVSPVQKPPDFVFEEDTSPSSSPSASLQVQIPESTVSVSPAINEASTSPKDNLQSSSEDSPVGSRRRLRGFLKKKSQNSTPEQQPQPQPAQQPLPPQIQIDNNEEIKGKYFGVSMQELMNNTEIKNNIPNIVSFFVEGLLTLGAEKTIGIFRLSPNKTDELEARKLIDSGTLQVPSDISVCSSLFKSWLCLLPEPLVPSSLYETAIAVKTQEEAAQLVIERIPSPEKETLCYIVQLLAHLSKEENAAVTCMTCDNIANIFGPCLLHCPYQEAEKRFICATKEADFVRMLIMAASALPDCGFQETLQDSCVPSRCSVGQIQ